MLSVEEALARVTGPLTPLASERISIYDALGRVLAEDAVSTLSHPPAPVSAMDGYAVRAADVSTVPASLRVIGESRAGQRFSGALSGGDAVRIFTGAVIPEGADAIVIQENTDRDGDLVEVNETVSSGTFIRAAGLDIKVGDVLVQAGRQLTARDVALIASGNIAEIAVYRRPKVAILSTGDELVMPGEEIGPDQIISSNSLALAGYVKTMGGEPKLLGIARDNREALGEALAGVVGCDMLVTIGGASVGDYDLVASELGERGLQLDFHKIAMRPGKPLIFGQYGDIPMLGLPGNPVSVGVTACLFLTPAIGVMSGLGPVAPPRARARLGRDLGKNDRREDYLRAALTRNEVGELVATPVDRQDSSMFAVFTHADGLVKRAVHAPPLAAGEWVDVIRFPSGPLAF